jgi:hypothetical protein
MRGTRDRARPTPLRYVKERVIGLVDKVGQNFQKETWNPLKTSALVERLCWERSLLDEAGAADHPRSTVCVVHEEEVPADPSLNVSLFHRCLGPDLVFLIDHGYSWICVDYGEVHRAMSDHDPVGMSLSIRNQWHQSYHH